MNPEESLQLIEDERRRIRRRIVFNPVVIQATWAVAWLVGFGVAYLAYGSDRVIPAWLGPTVPTVLILAAVALSITYGWRTGAGIAGPSRTSAAMYGWCWTLGFGCLTVINVGLVRHGMPNGTAILLWASSSLLLTGVLQLAGGALWRDRAAYLTGIVTMTGAAAAVPAGVPANFLVLALVGGGGFAALAVWHWWRTRRPVAAGETRRTR